MFTFTIPSHPVLWMFLPSLQVLIYSPFLNTPLSIVFSILFDLMPFQRHSSSHAFFCNLSEHNQATCSLSPYLFTQMHHRCCYGNETPVTHHPAVWVAMECVQSRLRGHGDKQTQLWAVTFTQRAPSFWEMENEIFQVDNDLLNNKRVVTCLLHYP